MQFRPNSLGEIQVAGDATHIRFVRRFDHPTEEVWGALTDREIIRSWWGEATVDLQKGVYFVRGLHCDSDGDFPEMHAVITELVAPRVLQIDGDLHGRLRFELEPDSEQTLMTFTNVISIPDEQQSLEMAGWHFHLDALEHALDGQPMDLVDFSSVFAPLHERYLQKSVRRNS